MSAQVAGQYRYAGASDCSFSQGSQIRNGQCGFAFESRSEDVPPVSAQQWDIMGVREQRKLLERVRDAGHRWGILGDKILRGLGHSSSCYEDERLVHERTCQDPAPPRSLRCDDEIERPGQQCIDEPVGDTWRDLEDEPSRYQRCNGGGNDFREQFSRSAEPHGSFQRRTATGAFQRGGKSLKGAGETRCGLNGARGGGHPASPSDEEAFADQTLESLQLSRNSRLGYPHPSGSS